MMIISVIVASYRRPAILSACLEGLRVQTQAPHEVIVVTRADDEETIESVSRLRTGWSGSALHAVSVERAGLVAALNTGLAAASGDLAAFVDDDAVPAVDWLERIADRFGHDEQIAGVGGRDAIVVEGSVVTAGRPRLPGRRGGAPRVGLIGWSGRMVGNHHLGQGGVRDVHVLKGANMCFRRELVMAHGFDERLRGRRTEDHSELSICLPLRRRRLRILYDPAILVWHHPAQRDAGDERVRRDRQAVADATHNEALALLDYFGPFRRLVFLAWGTIVGTTHAPGLVIAARELLAGKPGAVARWRAARAGRVDAWKTHRGIPRQPPRVGQVAARQTASPEAVVPGA